MKHKKHIKKVRPLHLLVLSICVFTLSVFATLYTPQNPRTQNDHSGDSTPGAVTQSKSDNGLTPDTPPKISHTDSTTTSPTTNIATSSPERQAKAVNPALPKSKDPIASSIRTEYPYKALGVMTNDPLYSTSLAYTKTGVAPAWNITTGSAPVVVAVIDTGFALQHEDLASQWYENPGETGMTALGDLCWTGTPSDKKTNDCDDDDNDYVDDWRGWNFYGVYNSGSQAWVQNNNPQAGVIDPLGAALSHGTEVAGLVGAKANNGVGTASPNWQTKIMPLQALSDNGDGISSDVVYAVYYAVNNGAKIINMSLGGDTNDPALAEAINYAYANDVLVVAASGNCGTGNEPGCDPAKPGAMGYPALNTHVVSVGASNGNDTRASFSSYGPSLDILAPGSGILQSTTIDTSSNPANYTNSYASNLYGTSFAAPIVSGIASLVASLNPLASIDEITAILNSSARKTSEMAGLPYTSYYGHGIVSTDFATSIESSFVSHADNQNPKLAQTGDSKSEHSFSSTELLSTGCEANPNTYCIIRIRNTLNHTTRFLPAKLTSPGGMTGWSWSGSILSAGEWDIQAYSDTLTSSTYPIFSKK